jgi:serine/threonine protein kinase
LESKHLLAELNTALEKFIADPVAEGHLWQRLAGEYDLLRRALQEAVNAAADPRALSVVPLYSCWILLKDERFKTAVETYYQQRYEASVNVDRLVRNSQALVATARAAVAARQSPASPDVSYQHLTSWAEQSANILQASAVLAPKANNLVQEHDPSSPAWFVHRAFDEIGASGTHSTAARYWSLYWLRRHTDLERHQRDIPVAAAYTRNNHGYLARLLLLQIDSNNTLAELIEHPQMALLPLGYILLEGMKRAWKTSSPQTVCWNLKTLPIMQDGDSLSGAAAVGFQSLYSLERYLSSCLVAARLADNGETLFAVGYERTKLEEAYRNGIRQVVIGAAEDPAGSQQKGNQHLRTDDETLLRRLGLKVTAVSTLDEAKIHASGVRGLTNKYLERYWVRKKLHSDAMSESWLGVNDDQSFFLIKVWRFDDSRLSDFIRALWDNELRTLYRLCSSPGAEESVLVMRDAGIDHDNQAYVMVLEGRGYETLDTTLEHRGDYKWLRRDNLRDKRVRELMWKGLRRVAAGIKLLHSQQVIHGRISAENIYLNPDQGPDSWRLGGFEWSVRLGGVATAGSHGTNWAIPPDQADEYTSNYTFDANWYAFGMLAARCFYMVEGFRNEGPDELNRLVFEEVTSSAEPLSDIERDLVLRLIAPLPSDRLSYGNDILILIDDIIKGLTTGSIAKIDDRPLVVVFNPARVDYYTAAREAGFLPDPSNSTIVYSYKNEHHVNALMDFLRTDFKEAMIYAVPYLNAYLLIGQRLNFLITQHNGEGLGTGPTWDVAFALDVSELRGGEGWNQCRDLRDSTIRFIPPNQVTPKLSRKNWDRYLPRLDREKILRIDLELFREFLRCTNQLEILMRYAEIFPYRVIDRKTSADGFEVITIEERQDKNRVPGFCKLDGGMLEFLQRERESNKKGSSTVLLTEQDILRLPRNTVEGWNIIDIRRGEQGDPGYLKLKRRVYEEDKAPLEGYLRAYGHHGQMTLIERRKNAIERLQEHSYLLCSLAQPGQVWIDTKQEKLPYELPSRIDTRKTAVIKDILRVRPIYALQGPPGTGKTTLVAHLLREILTEDPVAQILVTAQAHGAVDVLRDKVSNEAFEGVDEALLPLAVRLGGREDEDGIAAEGTVEQVALMLLLRVEEWLAKHPLDSQIQAQWGELLIKLLSAAKSRTPGEAGAFAEFQQLVKRGANIIYCTTSARDLEILAKDNQSFDWTVVEEAGKVHGCDLALPLQAGHRWLLLGDHKQLPPYRYDDFEDGIEALDEAVEILNQLSGRNRKLVDLNWVFAWRDRKEEEKKAFKEYALLWLKSFERIYNILSDEVHGGSARLTLDKSVGAAAGMLSSQYRMHPTIGDLISHTFYKEKVKNKTVERDNRTPIPEVCHPFESPAGIEGKAILWIDVPWCGKAAQYKEIGPQEGKPRYTNPHEATAIRDFLENLRSKTADPLLEIAVLSPYNQQVALLERTLRDQKLLEGLRSQGLQFRESLRAQQRMPEQPIRVAHTVDSFQGNQADIVVISLVRNNTKQPPKGLGFLDQSERLNVLLSRAEKLLVLVGSWTFFNKQLEAVSIDDVHADNWYWKKLLDTLRKAFESQVAIKLPYTPKVIKRA